MRRARARGECPGPKLEITETFGEYARLACGVCEHGRVVPGPRDERPRAREGFGIRELERTLDPAADELGVGPAPPHRRAGDGVKRELAVRLGRFGAIAALLE